MLSRAQVAAATTEELKELQKITEDELERRRREQAAKGKRARERGLRDQITVLETIDTPEGSYQWQMRECGHKDRCRKCKSGERHGPYLYCYYYENGRRKSEYIPLSRVAEWGLERPKATNIGSEADTELGPSTIRIMGNKDRIRKEIRRLRRRARDAIREYESIGVPAPKNLQSISEAYIREADALAGRLQDLE